MSRTPRWPKHLRPDPNPKIQLPSQGDPDSFDPNDFPPIPEIAGRTYTDDQAAAAANALAAVRGILGALAQPDETNSVAAGHDRDDLRDLFAAFDPMLSSVVAGGDYDYRLRDALRDVLANVLDVQGRPAWQNLAQAIDQATDLIFEFIGML